ncbi:hypothetical protein ACYZT4_17655 [Pseudomonas sp. GB2N2]
MLVCSLAPSQALAIEGLGLGADVDADPKIIDLADTSLWLTLLREAALVVKDAGIEKRISDESLELEPLLSKSIASEHAGVLLYATLVVDDNGDIFAPAGSMLGVTGVGAEPIDALAESLRQPSIRQLVTGRTKQVYFWVQKRRDGTLFARQIPVAGNALLNSAANAEAIRRNELVQIVGPSITANIEAFKLSDYWSKIEHERLANVTEKAYRDEITRLTSLLEGQNAQIDQKYKEFQNIYDSYKAAAQYQATLQSARSVLSLIEGAMSVSKLYCEDKPIGSKETAQESTLDGQIEIIRTKNQIMLQNATMMRDSLQIKYNGILVYEQQLNSQWQQSGVPLPTKPIQPNPFQRFTLP